MAILVVFYKIFNLGEGIIMPRLERSGEKNTVPCTRGFIKDAVDGTRRQRIVKKRYLSTVPKSDAAGETVFYI